MHSFHVHQTACHFITRYDELQPMLDVLADVQVLAVDTEFLRVNTFYPIAGLIQIASPSVCYLVDPIALQAEQSSAMHLLKSLIIDSQKTLLMHACSEDLEVFQLLFGVLPARIFDTQIAAGLVKPEQQLGLQKLLASYCGVTIAKDETRSDWTQRPLTDNQLNYAAIDVICLHELYQQLADKLTELGRISWCEEECQRLLKQYQQQPDHTRYYLSITNAWKLKSRQLQVLQALAQWREETARQKDKPRSFIFSDRELFLMADKMPTSIRALSALGKIKPMQVRRYGDQALAVIEMVLASDAQTVSKPERPVSSPVKKAVKELKLTLEALAKQLNVAPEKLSNRRNLEKLVVALLNKQPIPEFFLGWRQAALLPTLSSDFDQYQQNLNKANHTGEQ